jgi:hypothetical protein
LALPIVIDFPMTPYRAAASFSSQPVAMLL